MRIPVSGKQESCDTPQGRDQGWGLPCSGFPRRIWAGYVLAGETSPHGVRAWWPAGPFLGDPKALPQWALGKDPWDSAPVGSPLTSLPAAIFPGTENSSMGTLLLIMSRLHFSGSPPCRIMSTISLTQVVPEERNSSRGAARAASGVSALTIPQTSTRCHGGKEKSHKILS